MQQNLPETLNALMRDNENELRRRLEPLERRQQEFQQAAARMREDVRNLEINTARRLAEQQRTMRKTVQDTANRLRQETRDLVDNVRQEAHTLVEQERAERIQHVNETAERLRHETQVLLAEQAAQFTELVDQERQIRENQIRELHQRMDNEQERKDQLANSWIETARVLRDFICSHYRHEQFAPGQLTKLERTLQQAESNASQGTAEAALALAQQAYHGLSDLRLELERLEREWQLWRVRTLDSARETLALAQRNRTCPAVDLQGTEIDITIEVDHWTDGKVSALEAELDQLIAQVADEQATVSTDDLRRMADETLPTLRQRLEQAIEEARLSVISSQLRANIADTVVQTFEEQGFQIQDDTYEGEDYRNGFVAQVEHIDGSKVTIVVTPETEGRNTLQIHSYDAQGRSEHELSARAQAIARSLNHHGLQAGNPQGVADAPDPGYERVEEVRQRKPERQRARL
jgi:hypothetical protein